MYYANLAVNGVVEGLVVALAALSITLVFGIARFPNAATGDTMTFGAYVALAVQTWAGSVLLGGAAGVLAAAALSLALYASVFRRLEGRSVVAFLVVSIGLAFMIRAGLGLAFGHSQRVFQVPLQRPWLIGELRINPMDLRLALVAVATLAVCFAILYLTAIGRRMRAVADNRDLARVSGIDPRKVMVALWLLAGGIASVAGTMLGIKTVVSPEMGWETLLPAFAAAIVGGIGNPVGAVVAGILIGVLQELSTPIVGFTYKIAVSFVVMLAVLLVRPRGLFGSVEGAR